MVNSVGYNQNQVMALLQQRKSKNSQKLKNGDVEQIGGNDFAKGVWSKMFEGVDKQQGKELLQKRLMQKEMQAESNMKEVLVTRTGGTMNAPYGYLAKNGVIEYNGVIFVCDEKQNAICLGDMTDEANVLRIPLSKGGCLKVNRENLADFSKAISMFSPEDIRRIMEAIATDVKCQQMKLEMDETLSSIWRSTTMVSKNQGHTDEEVIAKQIAELFRDKANSESSSVQ